MVNTHIISQQFKATSGFTIKTFKVMCCSKLHSLDNSNAVVIHFISPQSNKRDQDYNCSLTTIRIVPQRSLPLLAPLLLLLWIQDCALLYRRWRSLERETAQRWWRSSCRRWWTAEKALSSSQSFVTCCGMCIRAICATRCRHVCTCSYCAQCCQTELLHSYDSLNRQ